MTVAGDAQPDHSVIRVQVLLAARGGCRHALADAAGAVAADAAGTLSGDARVIVLTEIDDDPFPAANPLCRPFEAVLEVEADVSVGADTLVAAIEGIGPRLADVAHVDLSGVLVGAPQAIIPCEPTPLRYLYLMRRKAHTTREAYLDYYFHQHSRFGFATPNILGYTQFHVDPDASASAASRLGLGSTVVDSVSELHLDSLEAFFAGIGDGRLGAEAAADEGTFVDRDNSVSFCTTTRVIAP
jgi:EthD domain